MHRQFIRRVLIPEGINKESIKCVNEGGRLCVCAKREHDTNAIRPIPIDVKKSSSTNEGQAKTK